MPTGAVLLTYVYPVGNRSVTVIPVPAPGPLFVALSVNTTFAPTIGAELSTDFIIARSVLTSDMVMSSVIEQPSGNMTLTEYVPGSVMLSSFAVLITLPPFFHSY
ncbi:hypothetical protein D3C86_699260 [compost metagenome]